MVKRIQFSKVALALLITWLTLDSAAFAKRGGSVLFLPLVTRLTPWQEVGPGSASGGGISNTGAGLSPAIAVAPDGTLYATWVDYGSGDAQIYVRRWSGSEWEEVGPGSASGGGISNVVDSAWPDIAIAADGTPYVTWEVYEGPTGGYYEIYVRRWDGINWVEVGAGSAGPGGISENPGVSRFPTIAITPEGTPYIAWNDDSGGNPEIYVRRWNGSVWEEVGTGSASGGGISNNGGISFHPSIAIDSDGDPYLAWEDPSGGTGLEIYVRRWNGTIWDEVGTGSASGNGISNSMTHSYAAEIAVSSYGTPYVVWQNQDAWPEDSSIYIRQWNGVNWVEVGAGSASGSGISEGPGSSIYPSIATAADGKPYVAWDQADLSGDIRDIYVRRWNGSAWEEAGVGSATGGGISSTGTGTGPAIAADVFGFIYTTWTNYTLVGADIYVRQHRE